MITPDVRKIGAPGLSPAAIPDVLRANGVPIPAGTLTEDGKSLTVQVGSRVASVDELEDLYLTPARPQRPGSAQQVRSRSGRRREPAAAQDRRRRRPAQSRPWPLKPVKLGDVADGRAGAGRRTSITRTNGKPSLGISVTMTPDGNAVAISHDGAATSCRSSTRRSATAPQLTVVFDQAPFVEKSIEGLTTEGLLGLVFAVLVILVFLLSVRSTLVTAVSIPLSVVDRADRAVGRRLLAQPAHAGRADDRGRPGGGRLDRGAGEHQATSRLRRGEARRRSSPAVREVAGAVTASTLTTVAVFAPIALVGGMVGQLFAPFAITVTVALLASLLVSLTVVPVLAYWFLKPRRR